MRNFYLSYCDSEKLASLVREINEMKAMLSESEEIARRLKIFDIWKSGPSYNAARSRKTGPEYEIAQNVLVEKSDLTVNDFPMSLSKNMGRNTWWRLYTMEMSD